MPFIVPITPSISATSVAFAPEVAAKYTLTGPDGTLATFNDSTDPNWVGNLDDITGLDSADVRESGDVLVQTDGGWQGNNWYGRRPITLSGTAFNNSDAATRAAKLDKIRRAANAMQSDAVLSWQNQAIGSVPMQTWVRRIQPIRFTGGWNKTFQIQLISQYAPLFSTTVHTPTTPFITNYVPDPSFEYDTVGSAPAAWSSTGPAFHVNAGATLTVQTTAQVGNNGMRAVTPGAADAEGGSISLGVLPAGTYTATAQVKGNAGGELLRICAGPASSSIVINSFTATTSFTSYSVTFTADGTSTQYVTVRTNGLHAYTFFVDAVIAAIGTPTWFSGDTAGAEWLGTHGNSASRMLVLQTPLVNLGNYPAAPVIRISGPTSDPVITNTTTGAVLKFIGGTVISSGHYIDVDVLNHTAILDGTTNVNGQIDFVNSAWPALIAGNNTYSLSEGSGGGILGGTLSFTWRDNWI